VARIAGVDLPKQKKLKVALQYIFGVGPKNSLDILQAIKIDPEIRVSELTGDQIARIRQEVEKNYKVEGALRTSIIEDIKRLISINSYRGLRHKRGLPMRGQRT